ncbi:Glycoside hydrolase [Macleaya cordata]|uniref:endo-polygalacturonase n=1 Tax=Macleaya cordata TaxID=56857 RepID=A0A200QI35_MACCD|nr:Glycoside hydrolase [Macleaya cordata]
MRELPRLNRLSSKKVFSVNDYGAKGDGYNNDTQAFKDAWEIVCSFPSRSIFKIPMGTYLVGPIDFAGPCRSKVTLRISGTIIAPKDPDVWRGLNPRKWIYFHGLKHFTVEGGVVDGMGEEWWKRSCKVNVTNAITFHKCKNLQVRNLMMVNSQQMHMAFTNCIRVKASHLKVIAPIGSPNTDAIHISQSTSVEVKSTIIETGDDCISIVSNSSRVRIRDISCTAGHGISIGSLGKYNSWSQVHDVLVDGAFLSNTENGVRIKTWQGGSGFAKNITFQNVLMENVSNPIIIDQYYCDSLLPCQNQTSSVTVGNISFMGIKGTSATEEAIRFACSDSSPCEGLYLEDIQLFSYSGGTTSSFCWEAKGFSSGQVYPPPCFSWSQSFIERNAPHNIDLAVSK